MTITKKLYAITVKATGKVYPKNDGDDRHLLANSKAHAIRVIKWLGLTGVTVREATEEEAAYACVDTVKA